MHDEAQRKARALAPTIAPTEAAHLGTAATIPPTPNPLGHAPTMMGLETSEPAPRARDIGSDPTMMGLPAEPAPRARDIGSDPTMMGLPAEPAPPTVDIGSAPTMMGLPAESPPRTVDIGCDPTMMGLPAESPRPSSPAVAGVIGASAHPTSLPLVTPAHAPAEPRRSTRTVMLAGGVVAALGLGGALWATLREPAPSPAATSAPGSAAQDVPGKEPEAAPVTAPASERRGKPPPDPEASKRSDDKGKGDGRSRPIRRAIRRIGI